MEKMGKLGRMWVKVEVKQIQFRKVSGNRNGMIRGVQRPKKFSLVIKKIQIIHRKIQSIHLVLMKVKKTTTHQRFKKSKILRMHTMLGKSWDLGVSVLLKKQQKKIMTRFVLSKAFQRKLLKIKKRLQSSLKKNRKF